jgi:hypothetical protein
MKNEEIDTYISQLKTIIYNLEKHQENKKQNTSTKTSKTPISRLQTIY